MLLHDFLESRNFTIKEFAVLVGVSPQAIYNYIRKGRVPNLTIANRIIMATKGKVTLEDLLLK